MIDQTLGREPFTRSQMQMAALHVWGSMVVHGSIYGGPWIAPHEPQLAPWRAMRMKLTIIFYARMWTTPCCDQAKVHAPRGNSAYVTFI